MSTQCEAGSWLTFASVETGLLLEAFQWLIILLFHLLLHLRHFDLVVIFDLCDFLLKFLTLGIPFVDLNRVNVHLLENLVHRFNFLFQLVYFNVSLFNELFPSFPHFLDLLLFFGLDLKDCLLWNSLFFLDLRLQLKHQFHVCCVLIRQSFYKSLTVFNLRFEVFNQSEIVATDAQYFLFFLFNHLFEFVHVAATQVRNRAWIT